MGEAIIRLIANPDMTDCDGDLQHNISVSMRQLPYPKYTENIFLSIVGTILPLFVILAYIYSAGVFTKVILAFLCVIFVFAMQHVCLCTELHVQTQFVLPKESPINSFASMTSY